MAENTRIFMVLGLVAVAPWIVSAAANPDIDGRTTVVTITGKASQSQQPPFLLVTSGVESDGSTAARAMATNMRTMARLRAALESAGIRAEDIRTVNLALSPRRDGSSGDIERFVAVHNLAITFRDVAQTGPVVDALVDAGANRIGGPAMTWRSVETSPEARLAAIRDANRQAEFYARSLGLRVHKVRTMRDGGSHSSPTPAARMGGAGTHVYPGEDVVHTSVVAEYELVR